MAENKTLTFKGRPLMRKDNIIYYGSMADSHIIMIQILDYKTVGDAEVANKVSIQLQVTDNITQCRRGQGLHSCHGVLHAVGVQLGVGDLEVHHGIDLHRNVILGDNRLGRIIVNLLFQAYLPGNSVNEGDLEMQTHTPNALERTQALNDVGTGLLNHHNIGDHQQKQNSCNYNCNCAVSYI